MLSNQMARLALVRSGELEKTMATTKAGGKDSLTKKRTEAGKHLRDAASKEERKVEARKGSDLKKGAERFEERAESANGKGAKA